MNRENLRNSGESVGSRERVVTCHLVIVKPLELVNPLKTSGRFVRVLNFPFNQIAKMLIKVSILFSTAMTSF